MEPKVDYFSFKTKNILCIDMKSFYASCAALIKGLDPLTAHLAVVADLERRGSVVLAATPALKRDYNIKTGNRLFEIPREEKIRIVAAQMNLYLQVSTQVTKLFNKYVPKEAIHTYSIDESFLEVDGLEKRWGSAEHIATLILQELKETFGLTAAIGIGPNMLMAKLCLDLEAKKYGIRRWTYRDVSSKLWKVSPLSEMWGIGSQLQKRLNRMGIKTVGELAHYPLRELEDEFGIMGNQLFYHANGIDLSELGSPILQGQISYGKSQILLRDYDDPRDVAYVILEMCEEVAFRARENKKIGKTIELGIGYGGSAGGFQRSLTMHTPTNITIDMYQACMYLFNKFYEGKTVRRISISLTNICADEHIQLDLFTKDVIREKTLGYTMDDVRKKYGKDALLRAVSFTSAGTARKRSRLVGGHYAD